MISAAAVVCQLLSSKPVLSAGTQVWVPSLDQMILLSSLNFSLSHCKTIIFLSSCIDGYKGKEQGKTRKSTIRKGSVGQGWLTLDKIRWTYRNVPQRLSRILLVCLLFQEGLVVQKWLTLEKSSLLCSFISWPLTTKRGEQDS